MRNGLSRITQLTGSPVRNLTVILMFVIVVGILSVIGYMHAGWNFGDAAYMTILTVFSVGFGEVHPIDTPYLHAVTVATIVLGCSGMIFLTGALVQVFTVIELKQLLGLDRVQSEIDRLQDHVVICGFGRMGSMLAKECKAGGARLVVLEKNDARLAEAQALGYLCHHSDATDEAALRAVGIERARVLATVLPDDAANVFITLSARSLNPTMEIIARGEMPSTERKLLQAGADKVVLPTHIGAERIAEMILFPETQRFIRGSERMQEMEKGLHDLGLEIEVVTAPAGGAMTGQTVAEAEKLGKGHFFIVQLNRQNGEILSRPTSDAVLQPGDGVVIVSRTGKVSIGSMFEAPAERMRAGRSLF